MAGRLMPNDAARAPVWREAYTEVSSNKPESIVVISLKLTWLAITNSINSSLSPLIPRNSSSFCCIEYCCAPGCPEVSGSRREDPHLARSHADQDDRP